jgi:hypothetical protein
MTGQLDEAIETLRTLPEDAQDAAANVISAYLAASDERDYALRLEAVEDVRRR